MTTGVARAGASSERLDPSVHREIAPSPVCSNHHASVLIAPHHVWSRVARTGWVVQH